MSVILVYLMMQDKSNHRPYFRHLSQTPGSEMDINDLFQGFRTHSCSTLYVSV